MKILIIEDEEVLVKVLQEKFEEEGFKVVIAESGEVVLPLVRKNKPDIILLDILLPKVNGIKLLSLLKSDEETSNIPVVVLSNLSDDEKVKEAMSLGAVDYFIKTDHPVNEVVDIVNKYALRAK